MKQFLYLLFSLCLLFSCNSTNEKTSEAQKEVDYWSFEGRDDQATGGIKMIPVNTPSGRFNVWTKRIGNNPKIKVLLLHGGPGMTHEIYESFDGFFPQEGIEYYYYDQLGSYYSDQPKDLS